jgi:hypothetical protein
MYPQPAQQWKKNYMYLLENEIILIGQKENIQNRFILNISKDKFNNICLTWYGATYL